MNLNIRKGAFQILAWFSSYSHAVNTIFPRWEHDIPILGTLYSHTGNMIFPRWEQSLTLMGTLNH